MHGSRAKLEVRAVVIKVGLFGKLDIIIAVIGEIIQEICEK